MGNGLVSRPDNVQRRFLTFCERKIAITEDSFLTRETFVIFAVVYRNVKRLSVIGNYIMYLLRNWEC